MRDRSAAASANPDDPPVVHLCQEADEPRLLGRNFEAFMTNWSELGCPGIDLESLEPFLDLQGLVTTGLADEWRSWLDARDSAD